MEEPEEDGPGVGDAHGLIAVLCGLGVLASTVVCCLDPIHNDSLVAIVMAMAAAALWSGLFGVVTRASEQGRALAWVGLASLTLASVLLCLATGLPRY